MLFGKNHSKSLVASLVVTSFLLGSIQVHAGEADVNALLSSKTKVTYYSHGPVENLKDLPQQTMKEKLLTAANGLLTVEMIRRLDQPARQLLRIAGLDGMLGKFFSLGAFYLTLDTIWKAFEKTPKILAALPEKRVAPRTEAIKTLQNKCEDKLRQDLAAEFAKDPSVYATKVRNIEVQSVEIDSEVYPKFNDRNDEFEIARDDMPKDHLQYIWKEISGFQRVNHINLKRAQPKIINGTLRLTAYTQTDGTCRTPSRAEINAALNIQEKKIGEAFIDQLVDEAGHWTNVSKIDCAAAQENLACGAVDVIGAQISNIDCDANKSGFLEGSKTHGFRVKADIKFGTDLVSEKNQNLLPISRVKSAECSVVQSALESASAEECEKMAEAANLGLVGVSGYISTNNRKGDPARHTSENKLVEAQLTASVLRDLVGDAPYIKASCENNRLKFAVNPVGGANETTLPTDTGSREAHKDLIPRITGSFGSIGIR